MKNQINIIEQDSQIGHMRESYRFSSYFNQFMAFGLIDMCKSNSKQTHIYRVPCTVCLYRNLAQLLNHFFPIVECDSY